MDHQDDTAVVYDAGEGRTHDEHAAEAYDFARRAEIFARSLNDPDPRIAGRTLRIWETCVAGAQWHAQMATYHAIVDQGWR
jgi:hypothetical protein